MFVFNKNSITTFLLVLILGILIWTGLSYVLQSTKTNYSGITFFREDVDFGVYFSGQGWIKPGKLLYEGGYAEYPPFALFYLTWPRLFTDNFEIYHWVLWSSNAIFLVLVGVLIWQLAKLLNLNKAPVWALLLPSVFYYSFNRFDIFPVFLVLLSLYLIFKQHFRSGWFIYGLAIMTKIYPLFLLPLFWFLTRDKQKKFWPHFIYVLAAIFSLTAAAVVSGGWSAAVVFYGVQASRAAEPGSFIYLLFSIWPSLATGHLLVYGLTQALQYALPLWWMGSALFNKYFNLRLQLVLATLTILLLICFNPFYSNQWWLWVLPFLILVIPPQKVWLVILYDLLNFLQFPIFFEIFGKLSNQFQLLVLLRSIVILLLIFVLLGEVFEYFRTPMFGQRYEPL